MKKYKYSLLINIILFTAILAGCASTDVKREDDAEGKAAAAGQGENIEKVKDVRVTEFILGVGDSVDITVYRHDDLKRSGKIDPSGKIMFPLIGDVQVAGRGIFTLRDELRERLSQYIVDPEVIITVTAVQSQKIIVLGEVNNPGVFTLDSDITVVEAISKAGGMSDDANLNNVLLIRREKDKPNIISLDLKNAFKGGDLSQNFAMQSGDIIYLPAAAIADVSWFFSHLSKILSPVVNLESGIVLWPQVKDVFRGKGGAASIVISQ